MTCLSYKSRDFIINNALHLVQSTVFLTQTRHVTLVKGTVQTLGSVTCSTHVVLFRCLEKYLVSLHCLYIKHFMLYNISSVACSLIFSSQCNLLGSIVGSDILCDLKGSALSLPCNPNYGKERILYGKLSVMAV